MLPHFSAPHRTGDTGEANLCEWGQVTVGDMSGHWWLPSPGDNLVDWNQTTLPGADSKFQCIWKFWYIKYHHSFFISFHPVFLKQGIIISIVWYQAALDTRPESVFMIEHLSLKRLCGPDIICYIRNNSTINLLYNFYASWIQYIEIFLFNQLFHPD